MTAVDVFLDAMSEPAGRCLADDAEDRSIRALRTWMSWREEYWAIRVEPERDLDTARGIGLGALVGAAVWSLIAVAVCLVRRAL